MPPAGEIQAAVLGSLAELAAVVILSAVADGSAAELRDARLIIARELGFPALRPNG